MPDVLVIDNCAWDILHAAGVDIESDLEGMSIEISAFGDIELPDEQNPPVAQYAREVLRRCGRVQKDFGFRDLNASGPADPRIGGFGDGRMISLSRKDYADTQPVKVGGIDGTKRKGSGLLANQTDVDYAERSFDFPVLTANAKDFKHAIAQGGKVIDLDKWDQQNQSFRDFMRENLSK